ncbi:hypothetical protein [Nitrosopumilus sp.]|nr:hypothetical protein [Nitrosopumilus sp.]
MEQFSSLVSSRLGVFSKKEMGIIVGISSVASIILYILYATGR